MSPPIAVAELESMPLSIVVARMLFISSCMNRASNWRETSLMVSAGLRAAAPRSASSEAPPAASCWVEDGRCMSDTLVSP
jgi:hypothetical protein